MPSNSIDSIINSIDRYFNVGGSLTLPPGVEYEESNSRALEVSPYMASFNSLEQFIKQQLAQSRFKYFVYGEMYRRDSWVRSTIDYIVRRACRDHDRLIDKDDPLNPDIEDLGDFLAECNDDFSFWDLKKKWLYDILKYGQAYGYVEMTIGRDPQPKAIWYMDSRITFPITDQHGTILFHVSSYNGVLSFFNKDEVIYWSIDNNSSNPNPIPNMETLVDTVAMELNANRFNASLFENKLNTGDVFSMPGAGDDEREDALRYLEDRHTKPENAWKTVILTGDARLVKDGRLDTSKDISFEQLITMSRFRVCSVFGISESLLGIPDRTNKATADVHERVAYVNTIRPLLEMFLERFNRRFIRGIYGSRAIELTPPLSSMLPTPGEIEAAGKVMDNGGLFSEWREMTGLPKLPNTDYLVMKIPGAGGLVRLDLTAMPGAGDAKFNFPAYERAHQQEQEAAQQMAQVGLESGETEQQYIPPRSQDQLQLDPISARVIDVSRSTNEPWIEAAYRMDYEDYVTRRDPMNPGSRGAATLYTTINGRNRYGKSPQGRKAQGQAANMGQDTPSSNNTLANVPDANMKPGIDDYTRIVIDSARTQINTLLRAAQEENWTNEEFFAEVENAGWLQVTGIEDFSDVRDARSTSDRLSELMPDNVFTIIGSDNQYRILQKSMDDIDADMQQTTGLSAKDAGTTPTGMKGRGNSTSASGARTPTTTKKKPKPRPLKPNTPNPNASKAQTGGTRSRTLYLPPQKVKRSLGEVVERLHKPGDSDDNNYSLLDAWTELVSLAQENGDNK